VAPSPATTLLRAIDIEKRYGATAALDGVSLDVENGEFLTLLGPSGSGKTTFLMVLAGFVAPTHGRLEENGEDVTERPPEERNYGMVFQGYALFPHMTVEDNIAFPLRTRRMDAGERRRLVRDIVETVGLTEQLKKRPNQLSGGQQQRVALARALVYSPKVMLLDEPLSALDKNLREQMQVELRRLHTETGTTFVFVTHDQSEALALSSRVAIFDHGRLHQVGSPSTVYEQPCNRFVAEFLGQINLFAITAPATDGEWVRGRFENGELASPAHAMRSNGKAVIAVRPEHIEIVRGAPDPGLNSVTATVASAVYGGARINLSLRTPGGTGVAMSVPAAQGEAAIAPGAEVRLAWPVEKSFLLPGEEATSTEPPASQEG
jgi:putative spermidine/putrescine transport system ATP-binding protein